MRKNGNYGESRVERRSLQMISGYDGEQDVTISSAGADIDLTTGTLPSGKSRANYYCRGVHNFGASDAVIAYYIEGDDTYTVRKVRVPSGGDKHFWINVTAINQANCTNAATVKFYFTERPIVADGSPLSE